LPYSQNKKTSQYCDNISHKAFQVEKIPALFSEVVEKLHTRTKISQKFKISKQICNQRFLKTKGTSSENRLNTKMNNASGYFLTILFMTIEQGLGTYASRAKCGSFDDGIWLA